MQRLLGIIDELVCSEIADELFVLPGGCCHDTCGSFGLYYLDGVRAYAGASTVDEHGLAGFELGTIV